MLLFQLQLLLLFLGFSGRILDVFLSLLLFVLSLHSGGKQILLRLFSCRCLDAAALLASAFLLVAANFRVYLVPFCAHSFRITFFACTAQHGTARRGATCSPPPLGQLGVRGTRSLILFLNKNSGSTTMMTRGRKRMRQRRWSWRSRFCGHVVR